jgi:peptide/nickel transport system ATP-binding protein
MTPLDIQGLSVVYPNGFCAVENLSLRVEEGTCVCIVGMSGSGKSTLARAILALLPHGAKVLGNLVLNGVSTTKLNVTARRSLCGTAVGYIPQDALAACNPLRRVAHHVAEAWNAHRFPVAMSTVVQRLTDLGIADASNKMHRRPHEWSGGMLQRGAIAAATAHNPALVVADEPTSALDFALAQEVLRHIRLASRSQLLITHDLELAALFADELVIMEGGRIAERGLPENLLQTPQSCAGRDLSKDSLIDQRIG